MISIFVMTRGRIEPLSKLLLSMKEKAYDINNVELWIGAHPCDLETVDFINKFSDFKINVHYVEIPKADLGLKPAVINRHRDILHPMVLQSKGKYLWIRNNGSTSISQLVATFIVNSILFYWGFGWEFWQGISVMLTIYFYKLILAVLDTPLIYLSVAMIKKKFDLPDASAEYS